jgi:hypothetical protein
LTEITAFRDEPMILASHPCSGGISLARRRTNSCRSMPSEEGFDNGLTKKMLWVRNG